MSFEGFDVFDELATDPALEENGAWFPLGKGGAALLVARANNKAFSKLLNKQIEAHKAVLDMEDDAADAKSDEIMIDVVARTLLLGWKNVGFKGEMKEYSLANAKLLLAVKDFRARVNGFANSFEAYKIKQEVQEGNA